MAGGGAGLTLPSMGGPPGPLTSPGSMGSGGGSGGGSGQSMQQQQHMMQQMIASVQGAIQIGLLPPHIITSATMANVRDRLLWLT